MVGTQRNFGLDIIRAISILLVLFAHRFPHHYEYGVVGVQIFFILSGFLIGQILINDFKKSPDSSTIVKFWKRRWFRTLPLYYLILTLKICVFGNPLGWKIIVYYLFLQANFVGIDFFPISWSLVVEEWFYIFLPLATIIFFSKGLEPKRFLIFLLSFIVFFFAVRFAWNFFQKGNIIYQFDCLLLGVLLALIKISYNFLYKKLSIAYLFIMGVTGIILCTLVLGDISQIPVFSPFYRVAWFFAISLFIFLIIPYTECSVFLNIRVKKIRPLFFFFTWTSILTYSIYLIHSAVLHVHFNTFEWINLFIQIILLYTVSFILYVFYEHPMMTLREKISLKQYIHSVKSVSFKH